MNSKILLVDDEAKILTSLRRAMSQEPYDIMTTSSAEQALEIMQTERFKVVISDERMIGMQGSEFLTLVKNRFPHTVRILLTGHGTLETAVTAVNKGEIYRFFTKPWDDIEIRFAVRSAIEKYDLEDENRCLLSTFKRQTLELKILEHRFPGIIWVEKDNEGNLVLDDMQAEEIGRLKELCDMEMKEVLVRR